jgi:glucose/mannose-6-phosphate isomerase
VSGATLPGTQVLDDPAELARRDPGAMLAEVAGAGGQARVALRAAQAAPLVGPLPEVMVVAGMGGSGIALAELASSRGAPLVAVEGGRMPRAALWSLVVPVCSAAEAAGVLPPLTDQVQAAADVLDEEAAALAPEVATAANPAKQAAGRLLDRLPVVWGSGQLGAVAATRFRTQCNENAKVPVVSGPLPEANHNDVMGLEGGLGPGRELVLLRDEAGEHDRDGRRLQAVLAALGVRDPLLRMAGKGPDLARLARLTAYADFASTYLGIARGVDPTPIRTLDQVKAALAGDPGTPP